MSDTYLPIKGGTLKTEQNVTRQWEFRLASLMYLVLQSN